VAAAAGSPDILVFEKKVGGGKEDIYLVPAGGGAERRLTDDPGTDILPRFTSDGRRVVFSSDRTGRFQVWEVPVEGGAPRRLRQNRAEEWQSGGHHVYVVDVASGREERASELLSGACEPRFSRDGRKVIHVDRSAVSRDRSRIVERDLASGRERVLVDWPALNYDPVYSPDGSEIAFASTVAGPNDVYRMRLSDGQSWRVTFGPGASRHPDYAPRR
jgi:Tol biopolymer transport system component